MSNDAAPEQSIQRDLDMFEFSEHDLAHIRSVGEVLERESDDLG